MIRYRAAGPDLPEVTPRQVAVLLAPMPVDKAYIDGIKQQSDDAMRLASQFVPINAHYSLSPLKK